uniref:NADH-ubiquinone oxidoreductase chain 2 n=1 Tax=Coleoptera sp. 5 KM-2017 TaxID=2219339 RepID=A0A346RFW0_9COLE|nr:NADH dehydrogenase subunit 2 [Coleoptera sp. 5 KM-2017]
MKYPYKILFFLSMLMGTLISVSSMSWFMAWIGLEINLLSLIPLMKTHDNSLSSEATIKYFIIQALASMLFLTSTFMEMYLPLNLKETSSFLISLTLFLKMGAAPLHFWLPEVTSGLNWEMNFLVLTWQKIAPMILITLTSMIPMFMAIFIIFSSFISGVQGLNQTCLRKILTYSSINHISWMLCAILYSLNLWFLYFLIYTIISANIIIIFLNNNTFQLYQINKLLSFNKKIKYFLMMNFLSLGGLPPFLGFFPKWMTINFMIKNNQYFLIFCLIILTLTTLYFYIRLCFSSFTISSKESLIMIFQNLSFFHFFLNFLSLTSLVICLVPSF